MKQLPNLLLKGLIAGVLLLAMYGCGGGSEAETTLVITVRDFNSGLAIQGGEVILYKTNSDYTYETNEYRKTNTDASGQATFTGIDSGIDYYFSATQAGKTNYAFTHQVGSVTKPRQTVTASTTIQ